MPIPRRLRNRAKSLRPHTKGRLICVFGAGRQSGSGQASLNGKGGRTLADAAIITDDNPRHEDPATIRAAIAAACPDAQIIGARRRRLRLPWPMAQPGDMV